MSWAGQSQRVGLKRTTRRKRAIDGEVPARQLFRELTEGAALFWAKRGGQPQPQFERRIRK